VLPDNEVPYGGRHTTVCTTGIQTPTKIPTLPTTKIFFGAIPSGL